VKCRVCRDAAVIEVRRHNANFCEEHFLAHCREQVKREIDHFHMLGRADRVLVAVSGGKDSLALWDILIELGYETEGLYLGLGIGEYSDESGDYARDFARARGLALREIDLRDDTAVRRGGDQDVHGGKVPRRRAHRVMVAHPYTAPR